MIVPPDESDRPTKDERMLGTVIYAVFMIWVIRQVIVGVDALVRIANALELLAG